MRTVLGPYVTTKLCIRTHTNTTQLGSLMGTGSLILPSRPLKPGYLAQVAGMDGLCHVNRLLKPPSEQDLPWTSFRDPDAVFYHRTYSRHIRYPPSCRR
jgi:hypothetical protein